MRVTIPPDVSWQDLDDRVVIVNFLTDSFVELEEIAAVIWRGLARAEPLESITSRIVHEFAVEEAAAHSDLIEFLHELNEQQFITLVNA